MKSRTFVQKMVGMEMRFVMNFVLNPIQIVLHIKRSKTLALTNSPPPSQRLKKMDLEISVRKMVGMEMKFVMNFAINPIQTANN